MWPWSAIEQRRHRGFDIIPGRSFCGVTNEFLQHRHVLAPAR
jgi:hypothetical protein